MGNLEQGPKGEFEERGVTKLVEEDKNLRGEFHNIREKLKQGGIFPEEKQRLEKRLEEINRECRPITEIFDQKSEGIYSEIMGVSFKQEEDEMKWRKKIEGNRKILEDAEKKLEEIKDIDPNLKSYFEERIKQKREQLLEVTGEELAATIGEAVGKATEAAATEAAATEAARVEAARVEATRIEEARRAEAARAEAARAKEGARRVEVERGSLPWEKLAREDEDRLIGQYEKESRLESGVKKDISSILQQETDRRRIDFAKEWFREHRDEIREKGYDIETEEDGYIVKVTSELGGFNELKTEEKYREAREEIDNLYALRMDFGKEKIPLDSQFLILNILNKRAERLKKEIDEVKERGKDSTVLEREGERLFQLRRELGKSITGKDLEKEVREEVEQVDENTILEELNLAMGRRGFMGRRIEITTGVGNNKKVVAEFRNKEEANEFLRKELVERRVEEQIRDLSTSSERAEGGIEEVYARVKKRLKTEFIEKNLKGEQRTKEQLREFEEGGGNPAELIDAILQREGPLRELTGDWKKDRQNISNFLEDWEISIDHNDMNQRLGRMAEKRMTYEKAVTKERGFIEWLLELIFEPARSR